MNNFRRIISDLLAVLLSVTGLLVYYYYFFFQELVLFDRISVMFLVYLGYFFFFGILVGFFSCNFETYIISGLFMIGFIVLHIVLFGYISAAIASIFLLLYPLNYIALCIMILAIAFFQICGSFTGIWFKILIAKLSKKPDKIKFAEKIGIPKNMITKYLEGEERAKKHNRFFFKKIKNKQEFANDKEEK